MMEIKTKDGVEMHISESGNLINITVNDAVYFDGGLGEIEITKEEALKVAKALLGLTKEG